MEKEQENWILVGFTNGMVSHAQVCKTEEEAIEIGRVFAAKGGKWYVCEARKKIERAETINIISFPS